MSNPNLKIKKSYSPARKIFIEEFPTSSSFASLSRLKHRKTKNYIKVRKSSVPNTPEKLGFHAYFKPRVLKEVFLFEPTDRNKCFKKLIPAESQRQTFEKKQTFLEKSKKLLSQMAQLSDDK